MDEAKVGENIRALRLAANLSQTEAARRAGITKSTLSKIEKGQTSSPISTLIAVAQALNAHLADFFRECPPTCRYVLTRAGQGKTIARDGTAHGYNYEALAVDYPGKPIEPFLLTISPGDKVAHFCHTGQEFVYMLSGTLEFTVGDDTLLLHPGDSLYFDPTQVHSLKPRGGPARFLCCFIETK